MKQICFLACVILLSTTQVSSADLTYSLVDHGLPDHTLTGSITVEETAPDDGFLTSAEVVAWSVSVSGTSINLAVDSSNPYGLLVFAGEVAITPTAITIPELSSTGSNGLSYISGLDSFRYDDQNFSDGGLITYQQIPNPTQEIQVANSDRTHAVRVVPEPSSFLGFGFVVIGTIIRRRR